jgi:hypothetical protein
VRPRPWRKHLRWLGCSPSPRATVSVPLPFPLGCPRPQDILDDHTNNGGTDASGNPILKDIG